MTRFRNLALAAVLVLTPALAAGCSSDAEVGDNTVSELEQQPGGVDSDRGAEPDQNNAGSTDDNAVPGESGNEAELDANNS